MDPLGRPDLELLLARQPLDQVGPGAGGVDHAPAAHLQLAPAQPVAHPHAHHRRAGPQRPDHLELRPDRGAVADRGAGHGHGVACVVEDHVVELDRAADPLGAQRRYLAERAGLAQVAVGLHAGGAAAAQQVVEQHAGAEGEPVEGRADQREEEGGGPGEVRAEPRHHQVALVRGLADQGEVELAQVAEAAVEDLAGAGRGAARQVAHLQQRHREAAGGRVEGHARAGDAAAHHHHVELLPGQPPQIPGPLLRTERTAPRGLLVFHGRVFPARG